MTEILRIGTPPIEVRLRRNARARRLTLRLSRLDGRATLTLPLSVSVAKAQDFAIRQEGWLRAQLEQTPETMRADIGGQIPYRGEICAVRAGEKRLRHEDGVFFVSPKNSSTQLKAFLKTRARDALAAPVAHYAGILGQEVHRITLRDTRSRWGSCTAQGHLMFSWRLVMAPPEVLDYVAAHEVAHLVEMNHSARFWAVVARLRPDYQTQRDWLRREGAGLHRVMFDS